MSVVSDGEKWDSVAGRFGFSSGFQCVPDERGDDFADGFALLCGDGLRGGKDVVVEIEGGAHSDEHHASRITHQMSILER